MQQAVFNTQLRCHIHSDQNTWLLLKRHKAQLSLDIFGFKFHQTYTWSIKKRSGRLQISISLSGQWSRSTCNKRFLTSFSTSHIHESQDAWLLLERLILLYCRTAESGYLRLHFLLSQQRSNAREPSFLFEAVIKFNVQQYMLNFFSLTSQGTRTRDGPGHRFPL